MHKKTKLKKKELYKDCDICGNVFLAKSDYFKSCDNCKKQRSNLKYKQIKDVHKQIMEKTHKEFETFSFFRKGGLLCYRVHYDKNLYSNSVKVFHDKKNTIAFLNECIDLIKQDIEKIKTYDFNQNIIKKDLKCFLKNG